jgi:hypothetical protein
MKLPSTRVRKLAPLCDCSRIHIKTSQVRHDTIAHLSMIAKELTSRLVAETKLPPAIKPALCLNT